MAKTGKQRILFFINGVSPSDEDKAEALALAGEGKIVCFRNVTRSKKDEAIEAFDGLAGDPPKWYIEAASKRKLVEAPEAPKVDANEVPPASPLASGEVVPPAPAARQGWAPNS